MNIPHPSTNHRPSIGDSFSGVASGFVTVLTRTLVGTPLSITPVSAGPCTPCQFRRVQTRRASSAGGGNAQEDP
eukprot:1181035-Prorocentrum_minimum.AAC.1